MRRGANGADAVETVNAAANVIASVDNRVSQASAQKRWWGNCWGLCKCFGSHKNKRIGHAVLVPEITSTCADVTAAEHPVQPPSIVLPFVAPPSSPVSFLLSEPPSATQSPTGQLSLTSASADMFSPSGPASIFAIGPYAHETQLVSPPVFSTFTTEPSTAPYTPPPESVHLTTPSSPEVPFARLLEPNLQCGEPGQRYPLSHYEFQSYQLQPGSPVSHLISPSSGISGSGTSSPFPDRDFTNGHPFFLEFRTGSPPKLLDLDNIVFREWESRRESGAVTPDASVPSQDNSFLSRRHSDIASLPDAHAELKNKETAGDHRVSFEITSEEVMERVGKKPLSSSKHVPVSVEDLKHPTEERSCMTANVNDRALIETSKAVSETTLAEDESEKRHKKIRTITLGSTKEFNFDNVDGENSDEPTISSDWWTNEKVLGEEEEGPCNNWSFLPMVPTGAS